MDAPDGGAHPLVVAVDGPAASGKSTVAGRLAAALGLAFLDTGLLYRAVGRRVLARGADPSDPAAALAEAAALAAADVDARLLGGEAVGRAASQAAAHPAVRAALLPFQRRFAAEGRGAVLAGRDVGTVVCPDARVKLFVTASPEARARRRFQELRPADPGLMFDQVLADMIERDRRDESRSVAPLRVAEGASVLDTTLLDADAAFEAALGRVEAALAGPP